MPNRWLVKSDPDHYDFADLVRDGKAVWDGVTNALALIHIRAMTKGDEAMVYETGDVKAVIGIARVESNPRPDPKAAEDRKSVV